MKRDEAFIKWFKSDGVWSQKGETLGQYNIALSAWRQSRIDILNNLEKNIFVDKLDIIQIAEYITEELNKARQDGL